MKTTKTEIKLTNPNNLEIIDKVLAIMGNVATRVEEVWGTEEDEVDIYYELCEGTSDSIGFLGDDSIGACTGLYMDGDDLIGIFNFGDDGNVEVAITEDVSLMKLSDL